MVLLLLACVDRRSPRTGSAPLSPFVVADSLRRLEQYQPAVSHYRRLGDSLALAGDTAGWWKAELWWSYSQMRLGQMDSAGQVLGQAFALAGADRKRQAWTRVVSSNLLSLRGQFDSAVVEAEQSRDLARDIDDPELQHAVSYALGWVYSGTGRQREALAADSEAVARLRALPSSPRTMLASALYGLGTDFYWLGRYTEASQNMEEALAMYRELGQDHGATRVMVALAEVHWRTSNSSRALELYDEALRNADQVGQNTNEVALLHNNVSLIFIERRNFEAARTHLEKALEIGRSTRQPYAQILALNNLGKIEVLSGNPASGRQLLEAGLHLADSLGFAVQAETVRIELVYAAADQGDFKAALRWAHAAVAAADSIGSPDLRVSALEARGLALELYGNASDATTSYLTALELIESWRGRVALGGQRMGPGQNYSYLYERTIRILLDQNRDSQAFGIAERARARLLLELMADRDGTHRPSTRSAQLQEELRDRLAERNAAKPDRQVALDREMSRISASLTSLEAAARRDDPGGPARHPAPASLADIRTRLVGENRSLLAFFWGQDFVYGWRINADTVRAARLGPADSLAALIDFLGATINAATPDTSWRAPARRAYQLLIAPLGPIDDDEILVIPDGPLAHTPLEVFLPGGAREPWGANRRLIYGPSASVLLALTRGRNPETWTHTMLAVGNPSVGRGRIRDSLRAANDLEPGSLPYAEEEARAVSDLFRGEGADLLLGRHATIDRWMKLGPSDYRYLHFATHARVNDRQPDRTHLVMSQGVLTLPEIRDLRLRAELVTLSACETALGRRVRGEGVIGLPHAFLAAGARGVLVTLWRIGDESAADFMREFYQELRAGQSPAEALRIVRHKWMTGDGPSAHPSRWAPFILVGGGADR
ncbi:MAG: CHAT domain-containing tetratricopeptide repeat protein [Gemmatimonadales bacterium]